MDYNIFQKNGIFILDESFGEKIVSFIKDPETNNYMDKIFHRNFSADRKAWLLQHNPRLYAVPQDVYPMTQYFNQDLIKFSIEDWQ